MLKCFLIAVLTTAAAWSASGKRLTPQMIVSMRAVQSVAISPDGGSAIYVVNEPVKASKDPANSELWLVSANGKSEKRLTDNPGADSSPQWSPDSKKIAFLSSRSGDSGNQIYLLEPGSPNVRRLSSHQSAVSAFAWSPDGKRIAYIAAAPLQSHEKARQDSGDDEMVFGISDHDRHAPLNKLWMLELSSGESRLVPTGRADVHVIALAWSPEGSKLLLTVAGENSMDGEWIRSRLVVIPADGGELRTYCSIQGKFARPRWRPDGAAVGFLGASEARDPSAGVLYVCRGEGSAPVSLTKGLPVTLAAYGWLPDSKTLLVSVIDRNSRYLAFFDPEDRNLKPLTKPGEVASADVSLSAKGDRIACIIEGPHQPPDVWLGGVKGPLTRLTHLNPSLEEVDYGEAEDIAWKAADGLEITGVLIKPVGYQTGRRYPFIVQVHGGPESVDLNGFQAQWGQFFAANGYAVLFPNYRGGVGRGPEYALKGNRSFGGNDFGDIMAGADEVIRRGIADPDRMGIGGWSYGGFMSAWAVTQTQRFKAAVMGVGVSNWFSLMGQTPLPLWTVQVHFETWPYDDPQAFRKNSPIEFVKQARTPTLILHGEVDPMIPVSQAKEFFRALRRYNVPSELVVYPREGHGLREPIHRLRAYERVLAWYDRYLKGPTNQAGTPAGARD